MGTDQAGLIRGMGKSRWCVVDQRRGILLAGMTRIDAHLAVNALRKIDGRDYFYAPEARAVRDED